MQNITGYTIDKKLYEGLNSVVYRGQRIADQQAVVVKLLKATYPSPKQVSLFRQEFEVAQNLSSEGVVQPEALVQEQSYCAFVMEDFGGDSLDRLELLGAISLSAFFQLALQMVSVVHQLHQHAILHKDINPSHFIWNPKTGQLKLIDFGSSTELSQEQPRFGAPHRVEGTLVYVSPEQTGRMNRRVDYRSDFYSLGATFYELLVGQPPFPMQDALELIHAHLALPPQPLHHQKPEIPETLSKLVLKLLSKDAEDRYQSAYGLKQDLMRCWEEWHATKTIQPFTLGQHEVLDRFHLPQRLYGRTEEVQTLLQALERVAAGHSELCLIAGPAGIGKTSLVQEIHQQLTLQRGYFLAGKFDLLQRNIPYVGFLEAFRSLIHHLLGEGDVALEVWQSQLLQALGDQGQVIVEVIPEVEWVIGPQPSVPELPFLESQLRFHQVFQRFVQTFAQADHPLVLFLDDLQWMDSGSQKLIETLLSSETTHSLLVIGSYRDNEVIPPHPWQQTLKTLHQSSTQISTLALSPLTQTHIETWLHDAFQADSESIRLFAALTLEKTGGNPFFIQEFWKSLHAQQLITFDGGSNQWHWDMAQIQSYRITENVVEMLRMNLQQLPVASQTVLKLAACIGSRFDLHTLALLENRPAAEVVQDLKDALQQGYLVTVSTGGSPQGEYQFVHDRIQQSAYELLAPQTRREWHWRIGGVLYQSLSADGPDRSLFDVVNHLNAGQSQIVDEAERIRLIQINLQAAQQAKQATAYSVAYDYLQMALQQLQEISDFWQTHEFLAHAVYEEAAEVAMLCGHFEAMERWSNTVLAQTPTLLERIKTHQTRLTAFMAQNRFPDVLQEGFPVLRDLGVEFPENPDEVVIHQTLKALIPRLESLSLDKLLALPDMTDTQQKAAMQVLDTLYLPSFLASSNLAILVSAKQVELALTFGNTRESIPAYASFALNLFPLYGDIELGYRLAQLSLQLIQKRQELYYYPTIYLTCAGFLLHWKDPYQDLLPRLHEAYRVGLDTGNYFHTANCLYSYVNGKYLTGSRALATVETEMAEAARTIQELKQEPVLVYHQIFWQAIQNLLGRNAEPWQLTGEVYKEEIMVPIQREANNHAGLFVHSFNKGSLCFLFERYAEAQTHLEDALQFPLTRGTFFTPIAQMYLSLTLLAQVPGVDLEAASQLLQQVKANQTKMKQWAEYGPANCHHRYLLVEAELARVQGRTQDARDLFDQAIDAAQQSKYLNDEGLACERAGAFYVALNRMRVARHYLEEAYYAYQQWGAKALVQKLETQYPQWFRSSQQVTVSETALPRETWSKSNETMDVTSVLKALQVLSEEIVLAKLLRKTMDIMVENAGAQSGCLLGPITSASTSEAASSWQMEVSHGQEESSGREEASELPWMMVNYVIKTQHYLVLNDASQERRFQQDSYVQQRNPKSVLCAPILHQGKLVAVLYLENDLAPGVFTESRVAVLKYLSSQAAISITNARLYAQQENALALETEARQALQNADRLKDEFLANTSHELRTPLYGMVGLTESLLDGTADVLLPSQRQDLKTILYSGQHLSALLNDLLDFSKIKHRELHLQQRAVDVRGLGNLVFALCRGMAPKKNVAWANQIPPHFPLVYADEDRLHQILFNLVNNAWKFTHQGQVELSALQEGDRVSIFVRDTGVGIAADQIPRIFESFQQADGSIAREYGGTGLGLAITQQLVKLHGGVLQVESQLGVGSTFSFSLPVAPAIATPSSRETVLPLMADSYLDLDDDQVEETDERETEKAAAVQGTQATVLVIEDNPINLRIVTQHLRHHQYTVHTALNGMEGLELVEEQIPDVVLLDLMMPRMSGYEVCQQIRQRYDSYQMPVIILTARNRVEDLVRALDSGANDYLTKPFSREELLARLQNQLEIKNAVERLQENQRLKKEIAQRMQKEAEHRMAQRRLARLLDSSEDGIMCVHANQKVLFCNQTAERLLGYQHQDLVGQPIHPLLPLVDQEKFRQLLHSATTTSVAHTPNTTLSLLTKEGKPCPHPAWLEKVTADEETIFTIFLKPSVSSEMALTDHSIPVTTKDIEGAVTETLTLLREGGTQVIGELREIDANLDQLGDLLPQNTPKDAIRRTLLVQMINMALQYWEESTQKTKIDLAEASGIWTVYEDGGTYRTRTLDKYLELKSLPKQPRWRDVLRTAYYVLRECPALESYRLNLEAVIQQFRQLS